MKNFFIIFLLFFFIFSNTAHPEDKIAIINIEYLMENSIAGKSIKSKISKLNKDNKKYF